MGTITADALVTDFAKRLAPQGGFISAKQTDFVIFVWRRENPAVMAGRGNADGSLLGPDDEFAGTWTLRRTPTGAGALALRWWSPSHTAAADAAVTLAAATTALLDRREAALDAGDMDAVKAITAELSALRSAS